MAVLFAGVCLAAVPGQVRLDATPAHAIARSVPALGDPPSRLAVAAVAEPSFPPSATPGSILEPSELAPAEAVMILPRAVLRNASEGPTGSPTTATPATPAVTVAAQDSLVPPTALVAPAPLPSLLDAAEAGRLAAAPELPRPVDIEQIADSEARSLRMAQLREPGLAVGGAPSLAARVDAMQVTLPRPPRLRDAERAALLVESPSHLLVRIGESALGKVALRTSEGHGFDVQLSGLLDLLADRFDSSEFERLRGSAAADTFVNFAQLRAMGLNLRYDPVYDELRVTG